VSVAVGGRDAGVVVGVVGEGEVLVVGVVVEIVRVAVVAVDELHTVVRVEVQAGVVTVGKNWTVSRGRLEVCHSRAHQTARGLEEGIDRGARTSLCLPHSAPLADDDEKLEIRGVGPAQ